MRLSCSKHAELNPSPPPRVLASLRISRARRRSAGGVAKAPGAAAAWLLDRARPSWSNPGNAGHGQQTATWPTPAPTPSCGIAHCPSEASILNAHVPVQLHGRHLAASKVTLVLTNTDTSAGDIQRTRASRG